MNSSGIKRGLAASAVAALAVAGIPALASSASAATGDVLQVGSVGPTLNGGSVGGVVVLKSKNITELEAEGGNLTLVNTALTGSPNTPTQTVSIVGTPVFTANASDSNPADGFDEITVHVAATTANAGDTASYAVFLDDNASGTVDAAEARVPVSQMTSGPLATVDVSPVSQSAAQGQTSGAYTVTLKDAAGRVTQLDGPDTISVASAEVTVTESDNSLDATELQLGTGSFTASSALATPVGSYPIVLDASAPATVPNTTVSLNVTKAANITAGEVDIVTGADDWNGFAHTDDGTTSVRVDQGTIRIDFDGDATDANSTVTLNLTGNGVTFGGKTTATVSTVLDANGVGSITITPDAGTVQDIDSITVAGSFAQTIDFDRAAPTTIKSASDPYFGKLKGTVSVTATVLDQFGLAYTTGFVSAQRTAGPNTDATPQVKPVGANGQTTFSFTDANATDGQSDTVTFGYLPDEFTPAPVLTDTTHIKWTTDGMGSNFKTSLEGVDTEGVGYKASDVTIIPLADTVVNAANEAATLDVSTAETGSEITVSVDNGALILAPGETKLSEGSSSITDTVAAGALPAGYQIIGTKSGVVTVTTTSAGRTETAQFTVAGQTDVNTARNVSVSGPAEVEHGTTQIPFVAVITDAFGNAIPNFPVSGLNVQVTGPAQFQDSDAVTDANGQIHLNVRVDADAAGDVGIRVQGLGYEFGAAADRLTAASNTDDGKGLSASSNVATATTTVKAAPVEPTKVDAQLVVTGKGARIDRIKGNAISEAAGAKATLLRNGKKVKTGVLTDNGNIVFRIKDRNGNKVTKYVVKIGATALTLRDRGVTRVR